MACTVIAHEKTEMKFPTACIVARYGVWGRSSTEMNMNVKQSNTHLPRTRPIIKI